jgi:two-component system, LytTR family, sensor kinase
MLVHNWNFNLIIEKINKYVKEQLIDRKYPSFHFVNTIGWIILIAADSFIVSPKEVFMSFSRFMENTLEWSSGYFITIYLRCIYQKYQYRTKSLFNTIIFILVISILSSILLFFAAHLIGVPFNLPRIDKYLAYVFSLRYIADMMTRNLPLMASWSLLYFGIKFWMDLVTEKERAERSDLLAQSAQLQMLRYQVNPHFLFNSFSSLRALIRSDANKAEEMVGKLSEFYRYTLLTKSSSEVPLIDEIDAIVHYAEIEKIRFEDKIDFDFNISSLAEEYPIPNFLLHPLVENAIKYGMKTSEMPLKIKIYAEVKNGRLFLTAMNSGKWVSINNGDFYGTGTGLSNIKSRLEYSFPGNHKFEIVEEEGYVKIKIEIYRELK